MADNVTLPGAGIVIITEDVGQGRQLPVSKIWTGASGSAVGPVTAENPFFVSVVSGALETGNLATIVARLPTLGAAAVSGSMPVTLPTVTSYHGNLSPPPVAGSQIVTGPGKVVGFQYASRIAASNVQLYDATAQPASGSSWSWAVPLPAGGTTSGVTAPVPFVSGLRLMLSNSTDGYNPLASTSGSLAYSISVEQ